MAGKDDWIRRTDEMVTNVRLIDDRTDARLVVVIEQPEIFLGGRGQAAANSGDVLKLCATAWSIRQAFVDDGREVMMVPVRTWKGNLPKSVTAARMRKHWGWKGEDHNESDAVGIGDWFVRRKCGLVPAR